MITFTDGFADQSGELEVHEFDCATGEYRGPCIVYVSAGCGLAPGHALDAPPRPKTGHVIQRLNGSWVEVEDHRGTVYRTCDGAAVEHAQLGPLPEGVTLKPRPSPDHLWKGGSWSIDAPLQAENRRILEAELLGRIDDAADEARQMLVGDPLRAVEYDKAASEALAFKDAGYPDQAIPRSIAADVSSGQTPRQIADSILAAHDRYEEKLHRIREIRLASKAQVRCLVQANDQDGASQCAESAVINLRAEGV